MLPPTVPPQGPQRDTMPRNLATLPQYAVVLVFIFLFFPPIFIASTPLITATWLFENAHSTARLAAARIFAVSYFRRRPAT